MFTLPSPDPGLEAGEGPNSVSDVLSWNCEGCTRGFCVNGFLLFLGGCRRAWWREKKRQQEKREAP